MVSRLVSRSIAGSVSLAALLHWDGVIVIVIVIVIFNVNVNVILVVVFDAGGVIVASGLVGSQTSGVVVGHRVYIHIY